MNLEAMILDLASEDYVGLWELKWRANALALNADTEDLSPALTEAVRTLIRKGKLSLFSGTNFVGEETQVPQAEVSTIISARHSWEPAAHGQAHVRVITPTPAP